MPDLATTLLSNALLVLPLGLLVFLMTRWLRHPGLAWALWGLVLLKFVTPAIWSLPIALPASSAAVDTMPVPQESRPVPAPPPASDSDAATSSDRRPAPTSAEFQQPLVDPEADLAETRAPLITEPLSPAPLGPADSAAIADQRAIVPSVVSTTILTGDDIDTRPATGSDEAAPDRATLAPAPAVAPVETASENEKAAALSIRFTQLASRIPQRAFVWLWAVWVAGSVITCAVAAVRLVRFHRLLGRAVPADEETISNARELAEPLGLRRLPDIRLADGRIPPLLYGGVRRAVILLPRQLFATLDAESRRTLLAHEMAHIARRDHWTRWLELLVRCLYWWHPLAWYAGRRLRDAEEQCCDARVVSLLPGSATAYARTILTTVDYLAGNSQAVPTLATGLQPLRRSVRPLHRRLTMIVEHKSTARMSWPTRLILVALALCILPLSLLAQPQKEQTSTGPAPLTIDIPALGNDLSSVDSRLFSFYVGVDDGNSADGSEISGATRVADSEEGSASGSDPRIKIMLSSADDVLNDLEWIVADVANEKREWNNNLYPSLDIFLFGVDRQQPIRFDLLISADERSGAIEHRWQPSFPIAEQGAQLQQFIRNNLQPIGIRVDRRDDDYYELLGTYIGWMRLVDDYACLAGYEADVTQSMTSPRATHDELARAGYRLAVELQNDAQSRSERLAMFENAERKFRFDRRPDESRAMARVRATLQKQKLALLQRLFVDVGRVTVGWTPDREREQGRLDFYADALADTPLADDIARIGTQPSAFSPIAIPADPIAGIRINSPIGTEDRDRLRILLSYSKPAAHEMIDGRQELAATDKSRAKKIVDHLLDLIISGIDTGRLDLMFDLEQAADGQPQILAGVGVTDGRQVEGLLSLVPGSFVEMDADSVADTDIHRLDLVQGWPQSLSDAFGLADTICVGTSDSRVWICSGPDSLGRLKRSIVEVASADASQAVTAPLCQFRLRSQPLLRLYDSLANEFGRHSDRSESSDARSQSSWQLLNSADVRKIALSATTDVDDRVSGQFQLVDNHIDGRILISHGLLRAAGEIMAALGELNVGSTDPLATKTKPTRSEVAAKTDVTPNETTITVQRKSYAIDGTLGQSVVRLLEQMQRSGLVEPLLAHLSGGNGAAWDGEQWNYQTSVTVITTPAAHKAIGAFIDGLRELRPAPGQSGPEELQIRRVVYDREASWDTSRELAGLLGEAVKMGHIGYVRIISDAQDRMVITTTDPVHKVLRPFVEFLNEQQAQRDAAMEGAGANPLAGVGGPAVGPVGTDPTSPGIPITGVPLTADDTAFARGMSSPPAAASPKRPQVVTAPQQAEEITVVAREYELHPAIVQPLRDFLDEVRDGLPIFSSRLLEGRSGTFGGMSAYGGESMAGFGGEFGEEMMEGYAMGFGGMMAGGPTRSTKLRILAPTAAQAVLGELLNALQPDPPPKKADDSSAAAEPETIVLVRGEYELGPDAAMRFAELLQTCEQHGLATPLMVTRNQTRVKVIASKELQAAIRGLISYLSENWKTAARNSVSDSARLGRVDGPRPYGLPATYRASAGTSPREGAEQSAELSREEQLHRVIESIDRVLGDDGKGREKALRAIESRGTEPLSDRLQEIRRETAESLFPLVEEMENFRDRLGSDHSLVKARQKKLVLARSKQLEDLAALDEQPQIQVRAWDRLGILVGALSSAELKLLKEKGYAGGMRVAFVRPEGPSAKAGLKKGFALAAINGVAVTSHGDLETALKLVDPSQSQIALVCMNGYDVLTGKIQIPPAASAQVEGLDLKIAELELDRANEALEATKRLVQKGYKTEADLKAAELEVLKAQRELERVKTLPVEADENNGNAPAYRPAPGGNLGVELPTDPA